MYKFSISSSLFKTLFRLLHVLDRAQEESWGNQKIWHFLLKAKDFCFAVQVSLIHNSDFTCSKDWSLWLKLKGQTWWGTLFQSRLAKIHYKQCAETEHLRHALIPEIDVHVSIQHSIVLVLLLHGYVLEETKYAWLPMVAVHWHVNHLKKCWFKMFPD